MRYNDSQDFADGIPLHTEDPVNYNVDASEEELPRKKSAVHHAFMATPTKQLRFQSTRPVREHTMEDQMMTESEIAKLD